MSGGPEAPSIDQAALLPSPPRPMSAGAPSSSPDPLPSPVDAPLSSVVVVAPSDPVAIASPAPPAPPAAVVEDEDDAVEDEEQRPWPPMRMKLFPYAVYRVTSGMGDAGLTFLIAFTVIVYLNTIAGILSFYTQGRQAVFWTVVSWILQFLCYGFTTYVTVVFIRDYMRVDGVYVEYIDMPPLRPAVGRVAVAAAAEELPPPPKEMDMC